MELLQYVVFAILGGVVVFGLFIGYLALAARVADAAEKKGRNRQSWLLIAFVFGLVLPAIIVAIMAPLEPRRKAPQVAPSPSPVPPTGRVCPFCAEDIKLEAIKCKHCGEMLNT